MNAPGQAITWNEIRQIVIDEIAAYTGPTGGWLDSPKSVRGSILARLPIDKEPVEYPSSPQVTREQMLQDLALQLDLALGELRLIDEALARRPALDDLGPKQRYEKIMRMCQFAGLGHDKAKQLPVGSEVKPRTQPCKHGILPPWECKDCMYEEVTPRTGEGS